jgi:hypothetical protein
MEIFAEPSSGTATMRVKMRGAPKLSITRPRMPHPMDTPGAGSSGIDCGCGAPRGTD